MKKRSAWTIYRLMSKGYLRETAVEFLTGLFNEILEKGKIAEEKR